MQNINGLLISRAWSVTLKKMVLFSQKALFSLKEAQNQTKINFCYTEMTFWISFYRRNMTNDGFLCKLHLQNEMFITSKQNTVDGI